MSQDIGLIGVGLLGSALAERLLEQGFRVFAFDTQPLPTDITGRGVVACEGPADVAAHAQTIVLCLPDSPAVRVVVEQLQPALQTHTIIDTTTGEPNATIEIGKQLATSGVSYLDATVAGSSQQMRNGDAAMLVGGDQAAFENSKLVFDAISSNCHYLGPIGSGSQMKLVVNLAIGLNRAVLAEALAFGESFGFDSHKVVEVLRSTPAHSDQMDTKGHKMADSNFEPQARLRQHYKDVRLILDSAKQNDARVPLSVVHATILSVLVEHGLGEEDNSAVINAFRTTDRNELTSENPTGDN